MDALAYRAETRLDEELDGLAIQLVTRAGFPEWGHIPQATHLLAECAEIDMGQRVLVLPCGHGALGVWAASLIDQQDITLMDVNCIAAEMAQRTLAANDCSGARVEAGLPSANDEPYDVVLLALPKGRALARMLFLACHRALKPGGKLYLAGPNSGGIKSAISDCELLFGPAMVLRYKGGNRIVLMTKTQDLAVTPERYAEPGMAEGTYHTFDIQFGAEAYAIRSRPGVFSWRELDAGTAMLIETLDVQPGEVALDVGCGYGLIGAYIARRAGNGHATLVDVDVLACECARETLAANEIENATVILGDGLAAVPDGEFTLVASNPPFHSGHAVDLQVAEAFVREAHDHLSHNGRLVLVANRFLPYDRVMAEVFGGSTALREDRQYRVLSATKSLRTKSRRGQHSTEERSRHKRARHR